MKTKPDEAQFIEMVRESYNGQAKVEIDINLSEERLFDFPEGHRALSLRLLLGNPKIIGAELIHPVELPAFGIYNPDRDGDMSEDAATGFMLRSALWRTNPGAPVLLRIPTLWTPGEVPRFIRRKP